MAFWLFQNLQKDDNKVVLGRCEDKHPKIHDEIQNLLTQEIKSSITCRVAITTPYSGIDMRRSIYRFHHGTSKG